MRLNDVLALRSITAAARAPARVVCTLFTAQPTIPSPSADAQDSQKGTVFICFTQRSMAESPYAALRSDRKGSAP